MSSVVTVLPAHACDCHAHVFCPERYPYDAGRAYTPAAAPLQALRQWQSSLGIERTVLVQPSCYGLDNRAMCEALRTLGVERARGVAVVDPAAVSESELDALQDLGVRGVRLNFHVHAGMDPSVLIQDFQAAADRISGRGWHVQLHVDSDTLAVLAPVLRNAKVPVVLDHFGGGAASMKTLASLLPCHHVWMKLSAPYRVSQVAEYADLAPMVHQCLEIAPDRLVWASDWPHTGGNGQRKGAVTEIEPFRKVDVAATLALLREWVSDTQQFNALMVDNPARLYGFEI
ncbi:Amidohydrolase-related domain-containing protein [Bordetella tumbae]|uniref:amidohydrolase family protein n=1 Tax=Bordetella tumbae TaxID=1649139 RepID=UPI0039EFCFBE